LKVGTDFLFGCSTGFYSNWLDPTGAAPPRERQGISENHAYSIMDAVEIKGHRLLKLRNPWGKKEWDGRWSDGSSEWTAEWMAALGHKFGNDGIFWISYEDLLRKYQHFDRTRIFGDEWSVTQTWTAVHVPWASEYLSTKFRVTLREKSSVVIVLAQLDDTYFGGLQGGYGFDLQFRLEADGPGGDEGDYIVRSNGNYAMARSVSTDIELEAGSYIVLMKITARKTGIDEVEDLLPMYAIERREKLINMALSYDLAHAKGILVESEKERDERMKQEKTRKAKEREKLKVELRKQAEKDWRKNKARYERDKKWREKRQKADATRMAMRRPPLGWSFSMEENVDSLEVVDGSEGDGEGAGAVKQKGPGNPLAPAASFRLKSFGGEAIPLPSTQSQVPKAPEAAEAAEAAPDAEQDAVAAAVADTISGLDPPKVPAQPSAEGIVQPLDEVIKQADAATSAISSEQQPTANVKVNGVDAITNVWPLPNKPRLSSQDGQGPAFTAIELFAFTEGENHPAHEATKPPPAADHDNPSDTDSFPKFDWRSDLDMQSDFSDTRKPHHPRRRPEPRIAKADEEGDWDNVIEPWNAVCVVGLRLYSLLKGEDVRVEVVRPVADSDDDDDDDDELGRREGEVKVLDRDDMSKGAVAAEVVGGLAWGVR
jgi:Calpain family cysteine protease